MLPNTGLVTEQSRGLSHGASPLHAITFAFWYHPALGQGGCRLPRPHLHLFWAPLQVALGFPCVRWPSTPRWPLQNLAWTPGAALPEYGQTPRAGLSQGALWVPVAAQAL